MDSKKKKKTTIKKFLDIDGLSHLINLFTSFVASYAAPKNHNHDTTYAAKSHTHDDRYYTEAEVDNKLGGKAPTSHTHTIANVANLQSSLDGKAAASHGHSAATTSAAGFMAAADKSKLDGVANGANKTIVDSSLSSTSVNPVQNKVVNSALAGKASSSHTHTWSQITGRPSIPSALTYMPVGYVYISWSSTSPASLFGGSWTAITGRFPYFNAGTGTGGSNTHKLSENEIPRHKHPQTFGQTNAVTGAYNEAYAYPYKVSGQYAKAVATVKEYLQSTNWTGGGASHNNMPAYQTLYAWRRTG